jgi:hypothetical protein
MPKRAPPKARRSQLALCTCTCTLHFAHPPQQPHQKGSNSVTRQLQLRIKFAPSPSPRPRVFFYCLCKCKCKCKMQMQMVDDCVRVRAKGTRLRLPALGAGGLLPLPLRSCWLLVRAHTAPAGCLLELKKHGLDGAVCGGAREARGPSEKKAIANEPFCPKTATSNRWLLSNYGHF